MWICIKVTYFCIVNLFFSCLYYCKWLGCPQTHLVLSTYLWKCLTPEWFLLGHILLIIWSPRESWWIIIKSTCKYRAFSLLLEEPLTGWAPPLPSSGDTGSCVAEVPGQIIAPSCLWLPTSYFLSLIVAHMRDVASPSVCPSWSWLWQSLQFAVESKCHTSCCVRWCQVRFSPFYVEPL